MNPEQDTEARVALILGAWEGPLGGLPPFDAIDAPSLELALERAIDARRAHIASLIANPAPPSFGNSVEAFERTGALFNRLQGLHGLYASTLAVGDMASAVQRMARTLALAKDEVELNGALFERIDAVWRERDVLGPMERRLTELIHDRMARNGAGLGPAEKQRLAALNAEIATLQARFAQNIMASQDGVFTVLEDEHALAGVPAALKASAAAAAAAKGLSGAWAMENNRPVVMQFLTQATDRSARERVWRLWAERGERAETGDNRPIAAQLLKLRGEKARLLGFANFADYATAPRMARTPKAAMALMRSVWERVLPVTQARIAQMQAIADNENAGIVLAPWDIYFYGAKLRKALFDLDAEAVRPYLDLRNVTALVLHQASRLHGLTFTELADAPKHAEHARVFAVSRGDEEIGALWLDLLARDGKSRGSFQHAFRLASSEAADTKPLSLVASSIAPPLDGEPALIGWDHANVVFHEIGHALHMLLDRAKYQSLGSMAVPWDFVETPALLNERWLYDRGALRSFLRHAQTGEPMPHALIDAIEAGHRFDRVFSLNLDFLASAIVDLTMHERADGRHIDPMAVQAEVFEDLGVPPASDHILRVPHAFHMFAGAYEAGVYVYLWADVMAADISSQFAAAEGGLFDERLADRWRDTMLTQGALRPLDEAFRAFAGRDPDPLALLARYGVDEESGANRAAAAP